MPWLGEMATSQLFILFELYVRNNDIEISAPGEKLIERRILMGFVGHYQSLDNNSAMYIHILRDTQNYN